MSPLRLFGLVAVLALFSSSAIAGELTAEERYTKVKSKTQHSGSVGFDKRHKAYRDYILEKRRGSPDETSVYDLEPAAGDEAKTNVNTTVDSQVPSSFKFND